MTPKYLPSLNHYMLQIPHQSEDPASPCEENEIKEYIHQAMTLYFYLLQTTGDVYVSSLTD